ncbi:MAG: serine/threonine-protein kinase, partial [Anaerolineales bacterium]
MPFEIGQTVGSYRLIQQMGQGGMATVYKAYHAALDRYVAIKVLHPVFTEDASFLARFQREAKTVARLEHPNIVPIYDYAEFEGRPYLVMKFIEGETLKARMARGELSQEEILNITQAVGNALAYAHQNKILHRDIKPSNVLLANDGQIYLADFGLARMAQSGESSLTADRLIGTPQYMSPEQALSKPNLDARTDIYSFGVMLYEMLVGRVPFNADTPFAVIHDHIYTPLPLPRQVKPDLPEAVERVLLKALAKNPDDRFTDVTELVSALEKAFSEAETIALVPAESAPAVVTETVPPPEPLPETPATETAPPAISRDPPQKKRPKTGLIIGGAVALLLLLAFCIMVTIRFVQNRNLQRLKVPTLTPPVHEVATPVQ